MWVKLKASQRRQRRSQRSDEVISVKGATGVKVTKKPVKKK